MKPLATQCPAQTTSLQTDIFPYAADMKKGIRIAASKVRSHGGGDQVDDALLVASVLYVGRFYGEHISADHLTNDE